MAEVAELVDRVVALPPGPELSTVLAALPWEKVPNARLVEVLQARYRQLSHEQAECYAGMVEIGHAVAVEDLPGDRVTAVLRTEDQFDWASHEIAAGLTLTPTTSDRELAFGVALCERLPLVFTALQQGRIDVGKARVFVEYLDPASGDVTETQARRLCERFVPLAPGLTTKQLADRLYRALLAIDPQLRRRRYERAVQERRVALYLDPRTGTATLVGDGLPADEAAAAAARIDRLAAAVTRAGHPGRLGQISSDLYLGMLNGEFHGLTENEIIHRLLDTRRAEDDPAADAEPDTDSDAARATGAAVIAEAAAQTEQHSPAGTETAGSAEEPGDADEPARAGRPGDAGEPAGATSPENTDETGSTGNARSTDAGDAETGDGGTTEAGDDGAADGGDGANGETGIGPDCAETGAGRPDAPHAGGRGRWAGERVGTREGIEIRAGLGVLAGLDDRPGEIPGLGPVGAHVARATTARQRRGARWLFAIVDTRGHLLPAGPLRRRPRTDTGTLPAVRGGVVELHLTLEELQRYAADPTLAEWHPLLAEIAHAWNDRDERRKRLVAHPSARFARGPLADHVCIRDRTCVGPSCTRTARRSDLDHTRDHGRGGRTVQANLGPACTRHHADKDRGWALTQPEPGLFRWTSPLGRVYWTRGEPVRPDLPDPDPDPDPAEHPSEETAADVDQRVHCHDSPMLKRPVKDPPRSPGPKPPPEPHPDGDPPPF
ncbi:DUF222 domain-containing protein [Pseudonocardia nantongensis]|uniref:HNH endonuclease signature motif containing protein n=1 Tax=Pseudonocardia nantongensis TaxID=1181885 RepID=UPI003978E929